MKHLVSLSLAGALIAAGAIGASTPSTHAASPRATMMMSQFAATSLAPVAMAPKPSTPAVQGTKVAGYVGMVAGSGMAMIPGMTKMGANEATVAIHVEGLASNMTYLARISLGSCGASLAPKYSLPNLTSNAMGEANGMATLMASVLPVKGYAVTVHENNAAKTVLACGNVHTPSMVSSIKAAAGSTANALAMITAPTKVLGNKMTTGTEVIVLATGLTPGAAHPFHIHAGPCGTNAPVQYALGDLVADAKGNALSGAGLTDIIPMAGVSIHIHTTSFQMIACGNIGAATMSAM